MRIKLAILIIILQPLIMKSQTAIATLGNITSCPGENVLVPLDVIDFNDVGAMTIYIGYDINVATFLSVQNINPLIPGSLSYYATNGQLSIAYSSPDPFYITDEKLFDLNFAYLGDTTLLTFNPGTEIANTVLEIIPLETSNGSIANSIEIIDQPDSVKSYPDNDVAFKVTSLGNSEYQWQENTGSGWANLQNNGIYSGVNTDSLTISDVPLSFNGYLYQCELTKEECIVITDIALLEVATAFPVATIGQISSCPDNTLLEPMLVGDFLDVIAFTFNIAFNTAELSFQDLENIHPDLLSGNLVTTPLLNPPGITIHWESADPVSITSGILFDMSFAYESGDQTLTFEDGTTVLNSFFNPINITLNNGLISQYLTPVIISQPENDTVLKNETAGFAIEANETETYQWLVSPDGGSNWIELIEAIPYYNTQTAELSISPATLDLDGNQYACRLSGTYCPVYSYAATLFVDTLTGIFNPGINSSSKIYPNPFTNSISITFPVGISYHTLYIYRTDGTLCLVQPINEPDNSHVHYADLSAIANGEYILKLSGSKEGVTISEQHKIFKIH
jgi:hypothetical protein